MAQLSFELYKWLSSIEVLPSNLRYKPSGNFQLDSKTNDDLISGYALVKLVRIIAGQKKVPLNDQLINSIKSSNTPAAKLYNWNILQENFSKLGITLTKQSQKEILAGNFAELVRFLSKIKLELYPKKNQKTQKQGNQPTNEEFDLKKLKNIQKVEDADSVLEFIIFIITKHLDVNFKQAVSILSQNCKYFSHMVVKGIKGTHQPIVDFYKVIIQKIVLLMHLCEKSPQRNTQFILELLRPSLISRQQEVAKIGCQTLSAFISQSQKYNSNNIIYQILSKSKVGFDFIYMGIKRHPQLVNSIAQFLYILIKNCCKDFFQVQFKISINNQIEYLKTIISILPSLLSNSDAKKTLFESKTIESWILSCKSSFDSKQKERKSQLQNIKFQIKFLFLELLCELWKSYSDQLSSADNEQLISRVIQQLKKNTRNEVYTIKFGAIYRLFDFLQFLGDHKNKFAVLIYKKIIFLFAQNHEDDEMRQVVLQNFTLILRKFQSIPLELLLEPLLKQLISKQGISYILNIYDMQFLIQVAKHPKMNTQNALSFLQFFSKLYIKSIIFSKYTLRIIDILTSRFCEEVQLIQFCKRNIEQSLNVYGMLTLGKKKMTKQQTVINNQKRSLIIQLYKLYIKLEHKQLHQFIQQKVVKIYTTWSDDRNYKDKGLQSILQQFGDVDAICYDYRLKQESIKESKLQSNEIESIKVSPLPYSKRSKIAKVENESPIRKVNQEYYDVFLKDGFGYKNNQKQSLIDIRKFKPDPKVLQDLERIKYKVKDEERKKMEKQINDKKNKNKQIPQSNELLQRNISLGYKRLQNINQDRIIFQFDSVKTKHLKQSQDFIELEIQQDRQKQSSQYILKKYSKYLKSIFNKYAYASMDRKNLTNTNDQDKLILSFTQIMRMLKDKGLNRIPKLIINQIMTYVNYEKRKQKNVNGGVYEQDFGKFLIELTYILNNVDKLLVDLPFGLYIERILRSLFEGENFFKQIQDPKIVKYKAILKENQFSQPEVPVGYKKIKENQVILSYNFQLQDSGIQDSYIVCFDILNWIYNKAMKTNLLCPIARYQEVKSIYPLPKLPKVRLTPQSTDKIVKLDVTDIGQDLKNTKDKNQNKSNDYSNSRKKNNTKSLSHNNLIKEKPNIINQMVTEQELKKAKKFQKRQQQLKKDLERLKEEKLKQQKDQIQKKKQQEEKIKKKQETRKKYLKDNKLKIQQKKQRYKAQQLQKQKQEEIRIEQQKQIKRKKQAQFLQMQKKLIQKKAQMRNSKKQAEEIKNSKSLNLKNTKSKQKLSQQALTHLAAAKDQKIKDQQFKLSLQEGQLKKTIDKYQNPLHELFQSYWVWDQQKIQIHSFAIMLKDFSIVPQLISPKTFAQIYKSISRGKALEYTGFKECLAKIAYKSDKIAQQVTIKSQKHESQNNQIKWNPQILDAFFVKLKMNQVNYKEIIRTTKQKNK